MFKTSHIFLYSLKYFGDKYGVRGSRFGHIFGRSRNVPKNIANDQESLLSHLGIIKTPKNSIIFKNLEQQASDLFVCRILGLIRPCFGTYLTRALQAPLWGQLLPHKALPEPSSICHCQGLINRAGH